jgi:4-hydroxybenzoate polyprenyltransferase and related prenyltransferases
MSRFFQLLKLMRIEQWIKNLFIFLPLFFSGELLSVSRFTACLVAFFGFGFIASSIYCLNDIRDLESDKLHPQKKTRPLANGKISKNMGIMTMITCFVLGISIIFFLVKGHQTLILAFSLFYFVINILYSIRLKQVAIIDVTIIATGFVIRIFIGGAAADVYLSHWIVLMTFLLSLFIAFGKRRDDFTIYDRSGIVARQNIVHYNFDFLNAALIITATITIMAYIMYTVSPEITARLQNNYVYTTSLFVLLGILRYLQITLVEKKSGNPTRLAVKDRFIRISIIGWIAAFILIMYI